MSLVEEFLNGRVSLHCGDCREVLATLPENSLDACVTDPPYLLTSITKRFGADGAAPAQFGSDGRYSRLSGGFMNKRWDAPGDSHGLSVFEAWLAGFIAGEGCFRIQTHKQNRYYTCQFGVHLRADDAPILVACQKRVGGRLVFHGARENKQGIKSAPDVRWIVETREGCLALANILDRVPLFAKKANDYALWRRGLDLWVNTPKANRWHGPRDVSEMAVLHRQLQEVKRWDGSEVDLNFDPFMPPAQAFHYRWAREVYRVLKPGAHLIAMGGTRTFHRLAAAIEDAGFECRDTISFLYGSGFPKSHDVSKGIDRAAGAEREVVGENPFTKGRKFGQGHYEGWEHPWMLDPNAGAKSLTIPATDAAREWAGWGTALKPAMELCVLARKPLSESTVAANVLRWGIGAINVDGCRVETSEVRTGSGSRAGNMGWGTGNENGNRYDLGRWPANVVHDGSDEVVAAFPETASGDTLTHHKFSESENIAMSGKNYARSPKQDHWGDSGSAARFFYTSKADADDRLGSKHPTVKPLDLMQWLVRLVTPPKGIVLDCFSGTGTTGEAAFREGMRAVLIEKEPEYQADIRRRMALALAGPDERQRESIKARNLPRDDGPLFGGTDLQGGHVRKIYGEFDHDKTGKRYEKPTAWAEFEDKDERPTAKPPRDDGPLFAGHETWAQMWAKPFDFSQEPGP